jgi:hypothetical protein
MTANLTRHTAAFLGLALFSLGRVVLAAPCGRPDIDSTFPPDGAVGVPKNATLAAHYASPAVYDAEPATVTAPDGSLVESTIAYDAADSLLRVTPNTSLSEGQHQLTWPGLRGVGGSVGRGRSISFTVGTGSDSTGPSFEGLLGIDWDLSRERDVCTDKLDDRFVFRLEAGAADDDAPSGLLSLLVFETRDPAADAASGPTQVARRAYPGDSGVIELRRPADAAGKTCFAAVVQDLLGNVSGGGERQVCVKTKQPPFFDGCSLVGPRRPSSRGAAWGLCLLGIGLLRRGRDARRRLA